MTQRIDGFIWAEWIVDKIVEKHGVSPEEVEEAFSNTHKVRRSETDKYVLYGRSSSGRYLFIVFAMKGYFAKVITARDMTNAERRLYKLK